MKWNRWAIALATTGFACVAAPISAEESQSPLLTALPATTLGGYVETSAIWKFGTGNQLVGRSYDGTEKQDGFNLHVVKLSLAKPVGEEAWSAGYQVDLLFGPDAGTFRKMTGDTPGDVAIEQACVKLTAPLGNGLTGTFGVFDSQCSYEQFDSYRNPNFSRSYGYWQMSRQHTGVVLGYPFSQSLFVAAAVANTCISPINGRPYRQTDAGVVPAAESDKMYAGAIYLTAPESWGCLKGATLQFVVGNGLNGQTTATSIRQTAFYVGSTIPTPLKGLSVGTAYNYLSWEGFYANASALYLMYQATAKLKFNNRVEYATGSSGMWTWPLGAAGMKPPGGEKFFAETFTVDYALWANVISRIEFRWDQDLTARRGVAAPFGNDDKNALSLALNLIYRF
jgi:hypothetical protein